MALSPSLSRDPRRHPPPSPESDWAALQEDLLALILKRLELIKEFLTFASVCKSWRTLTLGNRYLAPQPWLMLPPNNPDDKHHWQIYSLPKEYTLTKNFYIPELYDKRCIGLNYGWILTVSRLGREMNLVHLISRRQIELPDHASIKGYVGKETSPIYIFFCRVALCGNPSESSDFRVVAVPPTGMYVYWWRFGCKYWNSVEVPYSIREGRHDGIQDLICYRDQIYAITFSYTVVVLKIDHQGSTVPHLIREIESMELSNELAMYIVGSTRGLLVVARLEHEEEEEEEEAEIGVLEEEMHGYDWTTTEKFLVFEFDLTNGGYKKITNLGDRAIFVGDNTSMCFDYASELMEIKSNHIYFTDDCQFEGGGKDMGIYNLEDGRITRFKIEESASQSRSRICPPFWFIPSL